MPNIEQTRKRINEIDKSIADLFEKRMRAVEDIFEYKKEHGLPISDEKRENEVIERNSKLIENEAIRGYYVDFLKNTMKVSRQYQSRLQGNVKIAYSGIEGAFAHIAAMRIFPHGELVSYPNFTQAYNACENGDCDIALLPIENSSAGEVGSVTDLIFSGMLYINGVYRLTIEQNLLAVKGAKLEDIKTVISHRQALDQCSDFIENNGWKRVEETNTAIAAKKIADKNDLSVAAIAGLETAEIYGLDVLERKINRSSQNTTKFAVLSRVKPAVGNEKSVLMFTVSNKVGSLAKVVNIIGKFGYNMTTLRSRPLKDKSWQYYFYVETDSDIETDLGRIMIEELKEYCEIIKVAGSFTEKSI